MKDLSEAIRNVLEITDVQPGREYARLFVTLRERNSSRSYVRYAHQYNYEDSYRCSWHSILIYFHPETRFITYAHYVAKPTKKSPRVTHVQNVGEDEVERFLNASGKEDYLIVWGLNITTISYQLGVYVGPDNVRSTKISERKQLQDQWRNMGFLVTNTNDVTEVYGSDKAK